MTAPTLRNQAIRLTRGFFAAQNVIEVRTAKIVRSPALEPYIDALSVSHRQSGEKLYLATSPEFAMKKIFATEMAANPGARGTYEAAPVFRDDRPGKNHALEFTMIEWYLKDTSLSGILQMASELIADLGGKLGGHKVAGGLEVFELQNLFEKTGCGFEFSRESAVIEKYRTLHGKLPHHLNTADCAIACFNLLFDEYVLPEIKTMKHLVAVSGYPDYLAALAFTQSGIAQRAEIFYAGMELANAYCEEYRPEIAEKHWSEYNAIRRLRGIAEHTTDAALLAALPSLQGVSGIAVGLERVLTAFFPELALADFQTD